MNYDNLTSGEAAQLPDILTGLTQGSADDAFLKEQLAQAQALREGLSKQHSYGWMAGLGNGVGQAVAGIRQGQAMTDQKANMQKQADLLRQLYGIDTASRQRAAQPVDPVGPAKMVYPSDASLPSALGNYYQDQE